MTLLKPLRDSSFHLESLRGFYRQIFSVKKIHQSHVRKLYIADNRSVKYFHISARKSLPRRELSKLTKNSRTVQFFPKNKCQSKWSDRSLIRSFSRKWNNLPIEIRKEKTKNKFKEKLSSEMVKLHERVPIDRQVRRFRNFFY